MIQQPSTQRVQLSDSTRTDLRTLSDGGLNQVRVERWDTLHNPAATTQNGVEMQSAVAIDTVSNVVPFGESALKLPHGYLPIKRIFDIAFSALFLGLIGIWLFPLIGLAIKLDTPGPVFFKQKRVGQNGRLFKCLKFRTMVHNPEATFTQATKDDPRVTRVGRILRKTNLDELPQFINVLFGEMAVVGPRPHVPELDRMFSTAVVGYSHRNCVRPGVTGLAQVRGHRGETKSVREMGHRVRHDQFYLRNLGFFLDLKVIALTVVRLLQGDEKAY